MGGFFGSPDLPDREPDPELERLKREEEEKLKKLKLEDDERKKRFAKGMIGARSLITGGYTGYREPLGGAVV
jgi:hypothetical protein